MSHGYVYEDNNDSSSDEEIMDQIHQPHTVSSRSNDLLMEIMEISYDSIDETLDHKVYDIQYTMLLRYNQKKIIKNKNKIGLASLYLASMFYDQTQIDPDDWDMIGKKLEMNYSIIHKTAMKMLCYLNFIPMRYFFDNSQMYKDGTKIRDQLEITKNVVNSYLVSYYQSKYPRDLLMTNVFRHIFLCREQKISEDAIIAGSGSYGIVYEHELDPYGLVAVKKIHRSNAHTFLKELQVLVSIPHAHIIQLHEVSLTKKYMFFVMEYMKYNLREVTRGSMIKKHQILPFMKQLTLGLEALHNNKFIHSDLHEANVLVSEDLTTIKLCDFGTSTFMGAQKEIQQISKKCFLPNRAIEHIIDACKKSFCGPATRRYMNIYDNTYVGYSLSSDIWSLGCVFGYMLNGSHLFIGKDEEEMMNCILKSLNYQEKVYRGCSNWDTCGMSPRLKIQGGEQMNQLIFSMLDLEPDSRPSIYDCNRILNTLASVDD